MSDITYTRPLLAWNGLARHAHWLLRVALSSVYIYHGITKLPALEGMANMLGLPVAILLLVALGEVVGGAFILLGGFMSGVSRRWVTRFGVLIVTPIILGAIVLFHWGQWTFAPSATHAMGGMEFQVTLLLLQFYLLIKD